MNDVVFVAVVNAWKHLLHQDSSILFAELSTLENFIEQLASLADPWIIIIKSWLTQWRGSIFLRLQRIRTFLRYSGDPSRCQNNRRVNGRIGAFAGSVGKNDLQSLLECWSRWTACVSLLHPYGFFSAPLQHAARLTRGAHTCGLRRKHLCSVRLALLTRSKHLADSVIIFKFSSSLANKCRGRKLYCERSDTLFDLPLV